MCLKIKASHPDGQYWDYNLTVLFLSEVSATHLKIGCPVGALSSNELQRLEYMTGYQDNNLSSGCQGALLLTRFNFNPSINK